MTAVPAMGGDSSICTRGVTGSTPRGDNHDPPAASRGQAGADHLHVLNTKKKRVLKDPPDDPPTPFCAPPVQYQVVRPTDAAIVGDRHRRGEKSKRGEEDEGGLFRHSVTGATGAAAVESREKGGAGGWLLSQPL